MNWTDIIPNLAYIVTAVLGALLFPKISQTLEAATGKSNATLLVNLAAQVVRSVEQQLEGAPGNEKKAVAVAALKGLAEAHNLTINDATLHAAIEAAVYDLPKWLETSFGTTAAATDTAPAPATEQTPSTPAPTPASVATASDAQGAIAPFNPPPTAG
jgi:LL-H family phage holin